MTSGKLQGEVIDEPDCLRLTATQAEAEAALRSEIVPALWPGSALVAVTAKGTYTKKGKWRSFTFDVQFEPPTVETVVLTYGADTDVRRVFRRYYGERTDVTKTRPSGRAMLAEDAGCLAEVFPSDWKLATLLDALDEDTILPVLRDAAGVSTEAPAFRAHAFRFKPHRRSLIAYGIGSGSERREFIGKLFTDHERAQQGWDVLVQLYGNQQTREVVPCPVAFDRRLQLLIMDRMPGGMMSDILTAHPESLDQQVDAAAVLLARLHSVRIEVGDDDDPRTLDTELHKIESRFQTLGTDAPDLVDSMRVLVAMLKSRQCEPIAERDYSFLHGDYNPRQILVDGDDVRVVDLDGGCTGDPAVDVGRFMASLRASAVEHGSGLGELATERFLLAYEGRSGRSVRRRAKSIAVLRMLYRCERLLLMPTSANLALARVLLADASTVMDPPIMPEARLDSIATSPSAWRVVEAWLTGGLWRMPMRIAAAAVHFVAVLVGME